MLSEGATWTRAVGCQAMDVPSDGSGMTAEIIRLTTLDQLHSACGEWEAFADRVGNSNPFLTWDWVTTWYEHLGRGPLEILMVRSGGELVGIVPFEWVRYRWRFGPSVSSLQLIGSGASQYERRSVLCAPGDEMPVLQAALDALRQSGQSWAWAAIDGIPGDPALRHSLRRSALSRGLCIRFPSSYESQFQVLELPDSWDAFRRGLKRNIKESLRHCYNSLKREGHRLTFEIWNDPSSANAALEQFHTLHALRAMDNTGSIRHENYFKNPKVYSFLKATSDRMIRKGIMHPCFLRINGEIVATRLAFVLGGEMYLYYSGFDPRWWKYSVATTITAECIKWAIERGVRTVNLSSGTDVSKTRWGGSAAASGSAFFVPNGPLPLTAFRLYSTIRDFRRRRYAAAYADHRA